MDERSIPNPAGKALHMVEEADSLPGLYIHIPFCLRKCSYCGFYSITDRSLIPAYWSALRQEMALYPGWAASFDTLYIGGGTPSVLPEDDLEGLIAYIRTSFAITTNAEITVETNPADITKNLLASLRRSGVNRLNIGVQSFDDDTLAFLGRRHSARQASAAVHLARDAGIFVCECSFPRGWKTSFDVTADGAGHILHALGQPLYETHDGCALPLPERGGGDRRHIDVFSIRPSLQSVEDLHEIHLADVMAHGNEFIPLYARLLRELKDRFHMLFGLFRHLPVLQSSRIQVCYPEHICRNLLFIKGSYNVPSGR